MKILNIYILTGLFLFSTLIAVSQEKNILNKESFGFNTLGKAKKFKARIVNIAKSGDGGGGAAVGGGAGTAVGGGGGPAIIGVGGGGPATAGGGSVSVPTIK